MDFEVVHRAGIKERVDDAPSRLERAEEEDRSLNDDLPVLIMHTSTDSASEDEILSTDEQLGHSTTQGITFHH